MFSSFRVFVFFILNIGLTVCAEEVFVENNSGDAAIVSLLAGGTNLNVYFDNKSDYYNTIFHQYESHTTSPNQRVTLDIDVGNPIMVLNVPIDFAVTRKPRCTCCPVFCFFSCGSCCWCSKNVNQETSFNITYCLIAMEAEMEIEMKTKESILSVSKEKKSNVIARVYGNRCACVNEQNNPKVKCSEVTMPINKTNMTPTEERVSKEVSSNTIPVLKHGHSSSGDSWKKKLGLNNN